MLVHPVSFIISINSSGIIGLINCRTQLSGGEIYFVYYIGINYIISALMAIFRLID